MRISKTVAADGEVVIEIDTEATWSQEYFARDMAPEEYQIIREVLGVVPRTAFYLPSVTLETEATKAMVDAVNGGQTHAMSFKVSADGPNNPPSQEALGNAFGPEVMTSAKLDDMYGHGGDRIHSAWCADHSHDRDSYCIRVTADRGDTQREVEDELSRRAEDA